MGIHDLWLFVAAGFLLNITPGPDMALVIARSSQHGPRAGVAAALGVGAGTMVHIAAAAVGISALLMTSALAFSILKWIGALYLIWVGLRMVWTASKPAEPVNDDARASTASLRTYFTQGFLTNVFNPKVAIFFLAFLPQFIDADAPSKALSFMALGLVFNITGTVWNTLVALAVGRVAQTSAAGTIGPWLERVIGALFVGVGLRLAFAEQK